MKAFSSIKVSSNQLINEELGDLWMKNISPEEAHEMLQEGGYRISLARVRRLYEKIDEEFLAYHNIPT